MHVHISLLDWMNFVLNFIILIVPAKIIAANYVGRSALANAVYGVL